MFGRLMQIFADCSESFITSEESNILSGISERNLCGSLMVIIKDALKNTEFSSYFVDVEYNRNFDGKIKTIIDDRMEVTSITCDLIVHSRGNNLEQDNLIAIEMKRDTRNASEKNKDKIRLKALTKPANDSLTYSVDGRVLPEHVCGYVIGVYYEINTTARRVYIEYYKAGEYYKSYTRSF